MLICKHWKRSFILFRFTALVRRLELKSGNISSFWFVVPSWRFQRPLGIHKIYWSRLLGHLFRLVYVYLAQLYHEPNALLVVSSLSVHWHHKNSVVIESLTSLLKLKDSCFSTFCALSVLSKKKPVVVIWLAIYSFLLLFIQNIAPFLNGFDPPTSFPGSSPIELPWPRGPSRRGSWEWGLWSTG